VVEKMSGGVTPAAGERVRAAVAVLLDFARVGEIPPPQVTSWAQRAADQLDADTLAVAEQLAREAQARQARLEVCEHAWLDGPRGVRCVKWDTEFPEDA
jgi:hypothetical protein